MADTLTKIEETELNRCERVISDGMRTFYDVGNALRTIRDKRLYRATYETFEAYCEKVHGWVRSRAYQLIAATEVAEVAREMSTTVDIQSEGAARPIAALPEEKRKAAIREAQRLAEKENDERPIITSKHTKMAAAKFAVPKPPAEPAAPKKPAKSGAEKVQPKHRKEALSLFGKLVRSLDRLGIGEKCKAQMTAIQEAIKAA